MPFPYVDNLPHNRGEALDYLYRLPYMVHVRRNYNINVNRSQWVSRIEGYVRPLQKGKSQEPFIYVYNEGDTFAETMNGLWEKFKKDYEEKVK